MKMEFYRLLKSRRSLILIVCIILIPLFDLALNIYQVFYNDWISDSWPKKEYIYTPAYASFLSGSSIGHFGQMLLIWLLPFFLLLLYSDYPVQDKKSSITVIFQTKMKKSKIVKTQYIFAFISSFTVIFISVLINYGLSFIFFQGGTGFESMEEILPNKDDFFSYSVNNPNIVYPIYIVMFALIAAFYSLICVSLSMLFQKNKYVYPLAFIIWIVMIASKYSIVNVIQPFSLYEINEFLLGLAPLLISVIIIVSSVTIYKVKTDEL